MLPYAEIIESADRRWTLRLLDRLIAPDLPDEERLQVIEALQAVSDSRSFGRLEKPLLNVNETELIRKAAGSVLRGLHHVALDVPAEKLRLWWRNGDSLLRRHALLCMSGLSCPDIVLAVASDKTHPLQAEALGRMDFWFDLPEHEAIKIAGLAHPDPEVRAMAANVLVYDEPVAAEGPLIDATRDTDSEVATEAANTLKYYPSRRTLQCLGELRDHPDEKVRHEAQNSFADLRGQLLCCLCGKDRRVAGRIRHWLRPIWQLLAFTDEELLPDNDDETNDRPVEVEPTAPISEIISLLADPDISPILLGDRLRSNGWSGYSDAERHHLIPVMLNHPEQLVREQATWILAGWHHSDGLVELVRDADFYVRKTAMYWLGQMPPSRAFADLAWEHFQQRGVIGVHATETLATFVHHTEPSVAIKRLALMAADHGFGESLRVAALQHLRQLDAKKEIEPLMGLLLEPPAVTWAFHLCLLDAIVEWKLPRSDIRHLPNVDNLHVQAAVATLDM